MVCALVLSVNPYVGAWVSRQKLDEILKMKRAADT